MAIVNLTDNSFMSASRVADAGAAVARVRQLLSDGADMIDLGACSTAPGNDVVSQETELARIDAMVPAIFGAFPNAVYSMDSFRSAVASRTWEYALQFLRNPAKQLIINDISAGEEDAGMLPFVRDTGLRYIAMDRTDNPLEYLQGFAARADGIDWIADPGFGFGKSMERNWEIFHKIGEFKALGRDILVAISHKRMIWQMSGLTPDTCTDESVAAEIEAIRLGADIIRTHDVAVLAAAREMM